MANLKNESTGIAARKAALEILFRVNHKGAYADALLGDRLPEFELNDRRLITLMVLSTIAWRAQLDFEIERLASRPLAKIDAAVLEILRLALFQLRHLDRVPKHAAVDTAVTIANWSAAPAMRPVSSTRCCARLPVRVLRLSRLPMMKSVRSRSSIRIHDGLPNASSPPTVVQMPKR